MRKLAAFTDGFTFIELVVVVGILATVTGLAVVNLSGIQKRANLNANLQVLISDLKLQQTKAMEGSLEGSSQHNAFGVQFQSDRYVLFQGPSYAAGTASNHTIMLDTYITFSSISLPSSQIVFASGSGEIANYSSTNHSVTIRNSLDGEQKTVTINRFGVITSIQ